MTRTLITLFTGAAILFLTAPVDAARISAEAQRHFDRGTAAMEIAKTPEDYQLAIGEFERALLLAPKWPKAEYNLGLAEEKAGNFKDATEAFQTYLILAPQAPNAAAVQTRINKDQFKAEHVLTDDAALNILASLKDNNQWEIRSVGNTQEDAIGWVWSRITSIRRDPVKLRTLDITFDTQECAIRDGGHETSRAILNDQKAISFSSLVCLCPTTQDRCVFPRTTQLTVVSRNKVMLHAHVRHSAQGDYDFEFIRR